MYRAPELLLGRPPADATAALDIWSSGCVLAFVVRGQHLFPCNTQVGMIFAILKQRGGEPMEELATLPCWPQQPPNFGCSSPWPAPLPEVLGPLGEALLGRVFAPSPSQRLAAADCLAHAAMQIPWPAANPPPQPVAWVRLAQLEPPGLPPLATLPLWAPPGGDFNLHGGRGPWRLRSGELPADLLAWLRADEPFLDSAAWWAGCGLSWTGKSDSWYTESARKLQIAGKVGACEGSSLLTMKLARPFPCPRFLAFREAFVSLNGAALDKLHLALQGALVDAPESGCNLNDLRKHPREWFVTQATLQITKEGEAWQEPWHWDGGASLLHMGLTLWGERLLTARLADGSELQLPQRPGQVYLANLTSFEHQVSHPALEQQLQQAQLLQIPGQGECGVSVMMRTALFRAGRARLGNRPPPPQRLFELATGIVVDWLAESPLSLPSLSMCAAAVPAATAGIPHG